MKPLVRNLALTISAALLTACGGASYAPYAISNSQAVNALTNAKADNHFFVSDLVSLSNRGSKILRFTSSSWPVTNASPIFTEPCLGGGSLAYVYSKSPRNSFSNAGLSAGDYYSATYSQCREKAGGPVLSGSTIVTASTSTVGFDQSTGAFSLPVSIVFNDYREDKVAFEGTVDFSKNSVGVNGLGSEVLEAGTGSLKVSTLVSTSTFSNAALVYEVSALGTTISGTAFDVFSTLTGTQTSVVGSLVGAPAAPTSGQFTVTNVFGGRVVGTVPNLIQVDDGNDGLIDSSFLAAF
jgi:hypothetical protein